MKRAVQPHSGPFSGEEGEEREEGEEGVLARFAGGEEDIPLCDETSRLAVVDLEWDRIRAVDIFAVRVHPRSPSRLRQWPACAQPPVRNRLSESA